MTACRWQLQMQRSGLREGLHLLPPKDPGNGWMASSSASSRRPSRSSGWNGARSRLDEWFLLGRHQWAPLGRTYAILLRGSQRTHQVRAHPLFGSRPLFSLQATHLCHPTVLEWKIKGAHPSKPCRTTSALEGQAYSQAQHTIQQWSYRSFRPNSSGP